MSGRRVLLSWSSGKDCSWTLYTLKTDPSYADCTVVGLLTTFNEQNARVAMHGTRKEVVCAQSRALQLPLWQVDLPSPCSNEVYAKRMSALFKEALAAGVTHIAYGDLWLADVRKYRESTHEGTGIAPLFPIWLGGEEEAVCFERTKALAERMLAQGLRAYLCTVDTKAISRELCGKPLNASLLGALAAAGADCCGEKGEYHTCCFAGPHMGGSGVPVELAVPGDLVEKGQFVYADLCLPEAEAGGEPHPGGLVLNAAAFATREASLGAGWERAAALGEKLCPSSPPK